MVIKNSYRVGDSVTVKECWGGYTLPAGLPENATAKVIAMHGGYDDVEFEGKVFHVSSCCVHNGYTTVPD